MYRTAVVSWLLVLTLLPGLAGFARQPLNIKATEAADHVGKRATVCGVVSWTRFEEKASRRPTFVNFDKPAPDQVFRILIWGKSLKKFNSNPPGSWQDKQVCVTGKIVEDEKVPEIVVQSLGQVTLQ